MESAIIRNQNPSSAPALSVVVVVLAGRPYLARCLTALTQQVSGPEMEIIVPYDESMDYVPSLRLLFPEVKFHRVSGRRTYAELRAAGFRQARGALVALTEDHCMPAPDWAQRIVAAHSGPHAAVGGAVEKREPDTVLNWAVYLCDFSRYMNPVRSGPAFYLTDCNVSYKREALIEIADIWAEAFHETAVHGALRARGETLWLSPDIVVYQQRDLRLGPALRERYKFGRLFAGIRVAGQSGARRLIYAAFTPVLPALLVWRAAMNVLRKGRHRGSLLRALPAMALLASVWSFGELTGYLAGWPRSQESGAGRQNTLKRELENAGSGP